MPVVAYCRISADKTGAGLGVERQAADCRELALRLGLGEPEIITDNDLSAYSGKRRPGYERLKDGLRSGRWSGLVVWHVDRLCRSLRDLEDMVDLINGKVTVHTVKGGEIDLTSPEGRLQARMLGTMARYESEHRSDRVRRALDQNAEKGILHGGPRPYGWNQDGTLVPMEAAIVAELIRRVIGGESLRALAADLRAREVPSSRGAVWHPGAVKSIVLRARNAGLLDYRGQIVGPANHPGIVDRESWEAACALLSDPTRRTSPGNTHKRLLSGLMTCGVCEAPVRSGGGGKSGVPTYRCSTGGHVKRRVPLVDELVEAVVLDLLEREEIAAEAPPSVPDVREQADSLRVLLANLEDKYADGDLTRDGYLRNRDRLSARLTLLQRTEALSRIPGPLEGVTAQNFTELPLERRRAVVAYVARVRLLPALGNPHHNPKLVQITPRLRPQAAVVASAGGRAAAENKIN